MSTKPETQTYQFKVDHLDLFAQGVDKLTSPITFVAKVLPQETGEAQIYRTKKGVRFACATSITNASPKRIAPQCQHYQQCSGCQYLHCNYEDELEFKENALRRALRLDQSQEIVVHRSASRFHTRNRVQLHYAPSAIGLKSAYTGKILPIKSCLLPCEEIQGALNDLLANWKRALPKGQPKLGIVELYWTGQEVSIAWNQPRAHQGFTQVHNALAAKLREFVSSHTHEGNVLELFGGNGHLSAHAKGRRLVVDSYPREYDEFQQCDLYKAHNPEHVSFSERNFQHLVLDPPRSGLKQLQEWCQHFSPETICYISCDPATLARDLAGLSNYSIQEVELVDLFPGTRHFETCVYLTRTNP